MRSRAGRAPAGVGPPDERLDDILVFVDMEPVPEEEPPGPELARHRWDLVRGDRTWRLVMATAWVVAVSMLLLPVFVLPVLQARLLTRFTALAVALLGLQFVVGRAGQLSLCHGVYVGLGSYTTTILVGAREWPHLTGIALAPLVGFLGGCLVGLLSLRIRATYLGPVTLAVAVAFPMIVKRFAWLTGGSSGQPILRNLAGPSFFPAERPHLWNHVIVVTVAVVAFVCARNLARSPVGLAVRAVATVPLAASAYGINVGRYRVLAAGTGAAFGALGGALLVIDTPIVGADSYDLFRSLGYYAAVVVGGAASLAGAVLGSALLTGVPFILSTYGLLVGPNLVFGLLLLGSVFVAPGGLAARIEQWLSGMVRVEERPPTGTPNGMERREEHH
jgi:branched-chain amino acid transport system permease protein